MTIKEKALGLIGLERMSNREVLLDELAEMPAATLLELLEGNRLTERIVDLTCEDCHQLHGGMCPRPDDDADCELSEEDWLERPCERERLLPEGMTNG